MHETLLEQIERAIEASCDGLTQDIEGQITLITYKDILKLIKR